MAGRIGRVLAGRHRLLALIGVGASAEVYLAEDLVLRRQVAVKILHPELAADRAFLRSFRREAQSAAALNHRGLMVVHDWLESDDGPYLVLELLRGGSLRALLGTDERLSLSQALDVGLQAAQALEAAHAQGFVHRDIKPANLLFGDDGRLRIADFGLAQALSNSVWTEHEGGGRVQVANMVGTARYAAPEQFAGAAVDGRADLYALALVLVECVTGRVPASGDTPEATREARLAGDIEVPDELGPMQPLLARMGSRDPAARPSAQEVVGALVAVSRSLQAPEALPLAGVALTDDVAGDDAVTVLPDDALTVLPGDGTGFLPPVAAAGSPPRRRRRIRWIVASAALLALLGGGGAAVWAMNQPAVAPVPNLEGSDDADQVDALIQAAEQAGGVDWTVVTEQAYSDTFAVGALISQRPSPRTELKDGGTITLVFSLGRQPVAVPLGLAGLPQAEAENLLRAPGTDLEPLAVPEAHEEVPPGHVIDWKLPDQLGGTQQPQVPKGTTIVLRVSSGPRVRQVPAVAGKPLAEATATLAAEGLVVATTESFSDTVAAGVVIGSTPAAGADIGRGGTVTLNVSKGVDLVTIPGIIGLRAAEADARLTAAGLRSIAYGPLGGRVFRVVPGVGERVRRGSTVDVYLES